MSLPRQPAATPLAVPIDLTAAWNATDADLAQSLHRAYAPALPRLPDGPVVFRGLPFALGARSAGRRWVVLDGPVDVAFPTGRAEPPSHVVVAHFADSWRDGDGERPPAMPVGWVMPAGEPLAEYTLCLADGTERAVTIRRRFEIADGIIGWGFLPFEAVGHRADEPLDWRGPYPRLSPGRYAEPGQAGLLGMLPASWGPAQTAVADFVPTPDDDITLWLHAIPIPAEAEVAGIRLAARGGGRPGTATVIAAITLFHGTASPLVPTPRRQLRVEGPLDELPEVDLGLAIRRLPTVPPTELDAGPTGWGRPRQGPPEPADAWIVDVAGAPDARLRIGGSELPLASLDDTAPVPAGRLTVRALPRPTIRTAVRIRADGAPTAARIRFVSGDGRYLAPLGHRDEVNPALMEDVGTDLLLGGDAWAYVDGTAIVDLPAGPVRVEVVKGFEHRPVRLDLEVGPATGELAIDLERAVAVAPEWQTADPHVHYLAPSTSLVQAAAEDIALIHLLATQAGDLVTNGGDLAWGSQIDPTGRHAVIVGTENRQNLLGHLTLLGARAPVLPMAAGGAPEGRLGGEVDELLMDWADRCHAAGGLVIGAHFPLPYAEIAAAIATGRIDAIEMQTFAPRLDTPSIGEWYRFLNCGYRLPVLGGTDKMSAEVPVGAIRTYARVDAAVSAGASGDPWAVADPWAAAVRAGRTFATSGPILELALDGHEPGDVIALPRGGGRLEVRARARAAQPVIGAVEIVRNGRVVAREEATTPALDLSVNATVDVDGGSWIAARSLSDQVLHSAFATAMAAHTSPVYIEVAGRPIASAEDAEAIATIIEGSARWLETIAAVADPASRARMVEAIRSAADAVRQRAGGRQGGS